MPPAAGVLAQRDRIQANPLMVPAVVQHSQPPPPGVMMTTVSETFAKDAIISWFRGEFAAANAIIDAICSHLTQLESGSEAEYQSVFAAIHRRRMNWIPILHRQKYFSIADISMELKKVAAKKIEERNVVCTESCDEKMKNQESPAEESADLIENDGGEASERDDPPESEITDAGSQQVQPSLEHVDICSNHEECDVRRAQIKMTKGFIAKEPVKGHMENVVRGLKLYEDLFTDVELSKLNDFVKELRVAGQNGELSDETFILYNQQVKGNKRELIKLGVPVFGKINNDSTTQKIDYVEPIPALLQGVIEHLIQWHLIPEHRKPNSCIINFFDEGEYSQPFLKPPHLDQPLSTLLLSDSTMAFGCMLVNNGGGNYRGPLMLSLKEGSLLVMRGNSSDTARHVMCASLNKRVTITFFRVLAETQNTPAESPLSKVMTLWQPGAPNPNTIVTGYEPMSMIPKWSVMRSPLVMLAPVHPMVVSPKMVPGGGTGVFLPWTVGSRKPAKHLPPRAQRGRFLSLQSSVETRKDDTNSDSGLNNS